MPAYRIRALCLKKTKLGESDLIVTMLAEDGCQVRAVAKGARKPGSRFGGRVEPFTVADFMLHTGKSLETISDAEVVATHAALREDYDRAQAASVVADFLDKVSVECQKEERLFPLANATFDAMEVAEADTLLALVVAFVVKGMAMHGYRPQLAACASCGASADGPQLFSLEYGGPLCDGCAGEEAMTPGVVRLPEGARNALAALMNARMSEVERLAIPRPVLVEAFAVVRAFVGYHVPARMKAMDLFASEVQRAIS